MPRSARRLLIASLAVLHAALMAFGTCLHALPGAGHEAAPTTVGKRDRPRDPVERPHGPADDCPICHFLAQAQAPVESATVSSVHLPAAMEPDAAPARPDSRSHIAPRPRAPPLGLAPRA